LRDHRAETLGRWPPVLPAKSSKEEVCKKNSRNGEKVPRPPWAKRVLTKSRSGEGVEEKNANPDEWPGKKKG